MTLLGPVRLTEHLPGRHNQLTHGHGGKAGALAADLRKNGGGSYEAAGLAPITTGAVVARKGFSGVFDRDKFYADPAYRKEVVGSWLKEHRGQFKKGGQVGTWDSASEGGRTIVFDVIDHTTRAEAIRLGTQRGEDGIFDLDTGEYVPTGGSTYTGGG